MNVNRIANRPGIGWNNRYLGYHQGWVHGYWNGHYPGGWGWRGGYGYPGYGYWGGYGGGAWDMAAFGWGLGSGLGMGLGMGMGYGLSSWLFGPMLYNWGYSNYSNPYYGAAATAGRTTVVQQPIIYDYSQPINATAPPPDESVTNQAMSTFDQAREAFKQGDYTSALDLTDQALRQMPNDPTLHEFRALALFALGRYDEAAAALYAVLSVGPGLGLVDPDQSVRQPRDLHAAAPGPGSYVTQNPELGGGPLRPRLSLPDRRATPRRPPTAQGGRGLAAQGSALGPAPPAAPAVPQNSSTPASQAARGRRGPPVPAAGEPPPPAEPGPARRRKAS